MTSTYRMYPALRARLESVASGFRLAATHTNPSLYDEVIQALNECEDTFASITVAALFEGTNPNTVQEMFTYADKQREKQEVIFPPAKPWPFLTPGDVGDAHED